MSTCRIIRCLDVQKITNKKEPSGAIDGSFFQNILLDHSGSRPCWIQRCYFGVKQRAADMTTLPQCG